MAFKRLVTSLSASFDGFVAGVENHDAVAQSAITDVQKAASRLRAQQAQLAVQTQRFELTGRSLTEKQERWQTRALEFAKSDPEQALQCLRHRDRVAHQLADNAEQLTRQRGLQDQLAGHLAQVEARLAQLQQRRMALSSREARTNVLAKTGGADGSTIDEVFERWEVSVLQGEYREGAVGDPLTGASLGGLDIDSADQLDSALQSEERDRELRAELERLRTAPDT